MAVGIIGDERTRKGKIKLEKQIIKKGKEKKVV